MGITNLLKLLGRWKQIPIMVSNRCAKDELFDMDNIILSYNVI